MAGFSCKSLFIQLFCLFQASRLMVSQPALEDIANHLPSPFRTAPI